ncbi:MAG: hypothetical protein WDM80_13000 [Limisphaerales bacterium]
MKKKWFMFILATGAVIGFNPATLHAWDYEGHHAVNELALASLPKDFGGFELTPALKKPHRVSRGRAGPLAQRARSAA